MAIVDYRKLLSYGEEGSRPPGGIRGNTIVDIEARRRLLGLDDSPVAQAARDQLSDYGLTTRYIEGDTQEKRAAVSEAASCRAVQELVVNVLYRAGDRSRRANTSSLEATARALAETLLAAEAANPLLHQTRAQIPEQASPADQPAAPIAIEQHRRKANPFDATQTALRTSLHAEQHLYLVVDRLMRHLDLPAHELGPSL